MTRYEELCSVAQEARNEWIVKRDRCFQAVFALLGGLMQYCSIPDEQLIYLRWDGFPDGVFTVPEDGSRYTLAGAIAYSEDDDEWNIGVCLYLSRPGVLPRLNTRFGLFVAERDGRLTVRVGPEKPRTINLNVQTEREVFYNSLIDRMKAGFNGSDKVTEAIGFAYPKSSD